ncbi:universal stress protein, partial [Streptomyces sp. NPDC047968]
MAGLSSRGACERAWNGRVRGSSERALAYAIGLASRSGSGLII